MGNNFVTVEDIGDWTPKDFHLAIMGSIFGIVMEICKDTCVWGGKACLLILERAIASILLEAKRESLAASNSLHIPRTSLI